jgi:hypothetical protein
MEQTQTYGIAFTETPKGGHRAKIGPITSVPGKGDEPPSEVVSAVLSSEVFDAPGELGEAVNDVLYNSFALRVVGKGPAGYKPPELVTTDEPAPAAPAGPVPAQLLKIDGEPFDRRQLALLVSLDRKWSNYASRGAHRIWHELAEGRSMADAVAAANKALQLSLSTREGYDLAHAEAHRLGLYVAVVMNRDLVGQQPR